MKIDDYYLWKAWWYGVSYGMGPTMRMQLIDLLRSQQ